MRAKFWSFFLVALLVILGLTVSPLPGWATDDDDDDDDSSVNSDDSNRPGKYDPISTSERMMFRDDEVFMLSLMPTEQTLMYSYGDPSADLSTWSLNVGTTSVGDPIMNDYGGPLGELIDSASGRFLYPDHDSVVVAYFTSGGSVQVDFFDQGAVVKKITYDGPPERQVGIELAVGDIDRVVDDNGNFNDEIILVYSSGSSATEFTIRIIRPADDYSCDEYTVSESSGHQVNNIAVNIGDFDGDSFSDFAVGYTCCTDVLINKVFLYTIDHNPDHTPKTPITKTDLASITLPDTLSNQSFEMVAGDFDGDGTDEIVAFFNGGDLEYVYLKMTGGELQLVTRDTIFVDSSIIIEAIGATSGNFFISGDDKLSNGQIAFGYLAATTTNYLTDYFYLDYYYLDQDALTKIKGTNIKTASLVGADPPYSIHAFDMSKGNFIGHNDANNPDEQIGVNMSIYPNGVSSDIITYNYFIVYETGYDSSSNPTLTKVYDVQTDKRDLSTLLRSRPTITAYDRDGDSWYLGTPEHIVFDWLQSMDLVIQEPPKHLDYLPTDPLDESSDCQIYNIGATSDFAMTFTKSSEESTSYEHKSSTSWSIGGSAEMDLGYKCQTGIGDLEKVDMSVESKTKIGYNYDSSKDKWNSQYSSLSSTMSATTTNDDYIMATARIYDIWRYPILGYTPSASDGSDANYGVWELVIPGPSHLPLTGDGLGFSDWYQPVHENHNVLSYPKIVNGAWTPDDLGSFDVTGSDSSVNSPMNDQMIMSWGGTSGTQDLSWTSTAGSGSSKVYKHTLSESEELTTSVTAKGSAFFESDEITASLSVSFDNSNSWGGSTTSQCTNSNSTGISMSIPGGRNDDIGHQFTTAAYISSGGGYFKVAHAVDPTGRDTAAEWWNRQYNINPDPALSLPRRFKLDSSAANGWTLRVSDEDPDDPNMSSDSLDLRHQFRGCLLKSATANATTGKYDQLSMTAHDNETIQVCARVYNYSFVDQTSEWGYEPLSVRFQYVPYYTAMGEEVGDRVDIGTVDGIYLSAGEMKEVCTDWQIGTLSDAYPVYNNNNVLLGHAGYRIWVTLDPDDTIEEVHDWSSDQEVYGSNNEGYWPWSSEILIQSSNATKGPIYRDEYEPVDLSLHDKSLGIEQDGKLYDDGDIEVEVEQEIAVLLNIKSSGDHDRMQRVVFFEGNPADGAQAFGTATLFGARAENIYARATWRPKKPGVYELYAEVLEEDDDPNPGNAVDTLQVTVLGISDKDSSQDQACGCSVGTQTHKTSAPFDIPWLALAFCTVMLLRRKRR